MSRKYQNIYFTEISYTKYGKLPSIFEQSADRIKIEHKSKQFYPILQGCKQRLRSLRPSSRMTSAVSENGVAPEKTQFSVENRKKEE